MKKLILSLIALLSLASVADAQYYRQRFSQRERFRQRVVVRERAYAPLSIRQSVYAPLSIRQRVYAPAIIEEEVYGGDGILNFSIGRPRSRLFLGQRRSLLNFSIGD